MTFRFNPTDPAFIQEPYSTYSYMRREAPHLQALGTRIFSRYTDVLAALRERQLSVALIPQTISRTATKLRLEGFDQVTRFIRGSIVFTDNPAHLRLRRLVNQAYTPRALAELKSLIEEEVSSCLLLSEGAGAFDLVETLAKPLPVRVLCRWMNVDEDKRDEIAGHIHNVRLLLDPGMMSKRDYVRAATSLGQLTESFLDHAAQRRAHAGGLVNALACAQSDGDRLSDEEVAFACIMSFVAGTETTQCLIGNTFQALAAHPSQQRALQADASLAGRAVEETLRYQTPLQFSKRVAVEPAEINGLRIAAGEQILLCMGAANRDETAFTEPDVFDLARSGPGHVGFGFGLHACLGGQLARMQAEQVLLSMLERYGSWCADPAVTWQSESLILRGPTRLLCELPSVRSRSAGRQTARALDA
ncbi:MAG: cytochrome P450 [Ramlibacter sp.]|nr:cytochrome P450 [Ramlibacter sp.]